MPAPKNHFRALLRALTFKLLPGTCVLCGLASNRALDLCALCETQLAKNSSCCDSCALPLPQPIERCGDCLAQPPAFEKVIAPWIYQPPVSHFVSSFKNRGDFLFGNLLVGELIHSIETDSAQLPDILVPVPLHWRKHLHRGFNQAEWLASQLTQHFDIALLGNGLRKTSHTAPQRGLDRRQRQKNLRGSFTVIKPVEGMSIAVVDDVMTTGSTAEEIALILRQAGATTVNIWCLARTPLEK